jgi:hypothetical protein
MLGWLHMMETIPAMIQVIIMIGGVLQDGLGTGVGGGITDTIHSISSPIIILGITTATINLLMLRTIRLAMFCAILKNLTMEEKDSLHITIGVDSTDPLAMVEDTEDIDELV